MRQLGVVTRFALRSMSRSWVLWLLGGLLTSAPIVGGLILRHSGLWSVVVAGEDVIPPVSQATYVNVVVTALVYLIVLMCGGIITTSVAAERTSKVSILVFRLVSPATVVWGKIVALACVVDTTVIGVAIELWVLDTSGVLPVGGLIRVLGVSGIAPSRIVMGVAIAILGIGLYAVLYAIVGLLVTDSSQLQFAQLPVTVMLMIAFVSSLITMSDQGTRFASVLAYVPLTTPFVEVGRLLDDSVWAGEPLITVGLLVVSVMAATRSMNWLIHHRTGFGGTHSRVYS